MNFKAKLESVSVPTETPYLRMFRFVRRWGERFTAKQFSPPGVDSCPRMSSAAIAREINGDPGQSFIAEFLDNVPKTAQQGEIRIYSTSDGSTVVHYVYAKLDTLELDGSANGGLVKIVELTAKLNALIAELQAHTHPSTNAVPNQTFTAFTQTDYENTRVKHG